jgi:hypothetical protein
MVLFDRGFFDTTAKIWPALQWIAGEKGFAEMIALADSADEAVAFIRKHPPVKKQDGETRKIPKMAAVDPRPGG